jgi:hypothetical protein
MAVFRLTAIARAMALAVLAGWGPAAAVAADPAGSTAPAAPPAPTAMSPAPDTPWPERPRREDPRKIALPPLVIPQDPAAADRRPIYVGAGLVVLAAVFRWNRRRRERFEREDGAPVRTRRERRPARDEDADDLHAAARGEPPEPHGAYDPPETPERHNPS